MVNVSVPASPPTSNPSENSRPDSPLLESCRAGCHTSSWPCRSQRTSPVPRSAGVVVGKRPGVRRDGRRRTPWHRLCSTDRTRSATIETRKGSKGEWRPRRFGSSVPSTSRGSPPAKPRRCSKHRAGTSTTRRPPSARPRSRRLAQRSCFPRGVAKSVAPGVVGRLRFCTAESINNSPQKSGCLPLTRPRRSADYRPREHWHGTHAQDAGKSTSPRVSWAPIPEPDGPDRGAEGCRLDFQGGNTMPTDGGFRSRAGQHSARVVFGAASRFC